MAYLQIIPTKASVERVWERYSALAAAIHSDPEMREDPVLRLGLQRQHERFCQVYSDWNGK